MNGLGGLNKSPGGVVVGLVQLQNPVVSTPDDLAAQCRRICDLTTKARRGMPSMDLVVFPEYSLHGLSMDTNPEIMCRIDGPEVEAFRDTCRANKIWGCFSIMELNPRGNPYNTGIILDADGELRLYYRKLHPWIPVEPWEPGDLGIPVCDGPNGSRIGLIICHDGMFPEMARECAYKGAEIMIRTAGYTAPVRHAWRITNQANAFCNLMATASVCLCGSDGTFDSMGEGMIVGFDGVPTVTGGARPDEIITGEIARTWFARRGASGALKTTSISSVTEVTWPSRGARVIAPTRSCRTWWRVVTIFRGRTTSSTATAHRVDFHPHRANTVPARRRPRLSIRSRDHCAR